MNWPTKYDLLDVLQHEINQGKTPELYGRTREMQDIVEVKVDLRVSSLGKFSASILSPDSLAPGSYRAQILSSQIVKDNPSSEYFKPFTSWPEEDGVYEIDDNTGIPGFSCYYLGTWHQVCDTAQIAAQAAGGADHWILAGRCKGWRPIPNIKSSIRQEDPILDRVGLQNGLQRGRTAPGITESDDSFRRRILLGIERGK